MSTMSQTISSLASKITNGGAPPPARNGVALPDVSLSASVKPTVPTGNKAVDAVNAAMPDLPAGLKLSKDERKAAWKGKKAKPVADIVAAEKKKVEEPATKALRKEIEAKAKQSKEQRLRLLREAAEAKKIAAHPVTRIPAGVTTLRKDGKPKKAAAKAAPAKPEKTKAAKPSAKKEGTRARYDWDTARERAAQGHLPTPPDFSANTHRYYRPKLAELVKMAKAGDVKGLQGYKIAGGSTSPTAMKRYKECALIALKAKTS